MHSPELPTTAGRLAARFGGRVEGNGAAEIERLSALDSAGPGSLSFLAHRKYRGALKKADGAVVLVTEGSADTTLPVTFVVVADPQAAFAAMAEEFRPKPFSKEVHPTAHIASTVQLGRGVTVGPFAVLEDGVVVGDRTQIGASSYIGRDCRLGEDCEIFPRVTLLDRVEIGHRVRVLPGAVIGSEGFGLYTKDGLPRPMPHIGSVVIEDDSRIGANVAIDRATLGETRIGRGTMLDNLVHIAHNCQIGPSCVICASAALAGSVSLGAGVQLGGQVGIAPGTKIGAGAAMGAQAGTNVDIPPGEKYFLSPAVPLREALAMVRIWRKLVKSSGDSA